MRSITALALVLSLAGPSSARQIRLVLPDTTLNAASGAAVKPILESELARKAAQGRLGLVFVLEGRANDSGDGSNTILKFGTAHRPVPPADTLIVADTSGRAIRGLERLLRTVDPTRQAHLTSNGRAGYVVQRKSYFSTSTGADQGYGVLYQLNDISTARIQVLGAYENAGGGKGQWVGELSLELPNLLGSLRYLRIELRRLSSATQQLGLTYAEPYLAIFPVGGRVSFSQDTRDSLYVQRDLKVQLTSLPGQPWNVALGIGRRELQVTGGAAGQSYRSSTINLALFRSTLDRYPNPGRGYQLDLESETGTLTGPLLPPDAALSRARLKGLLIVSPGWLARFNLVWAQELLALGTAGHRYDPQAADFGRFGGSTSLRGYREDQFAAVWGVVSRSELRYRSGPTSRLHLFVDSARLAGLEPLLAAGAGLVVSAGGNLIQVDFAWTRHDRWQEGKVHFRLTNPFGQGLAGL